MDGGMNGGQEKECGLCGGRERRRGRRRVHRDERREGAVQVCLRGITRWDTQSAIQSGGGKLRRFKRKEVTSFFTIGPFFSSLPRSR